MCYFPDCTPLRDEANVPPAMLAMAAESVEIFLGTRVGSTCVLADWDFVLYKTPTTVAEVGAMGIMRIIHNPVQGGFSQIRVSSKMCGPYISASFSWKNPSR